MESISVGEIKLSLRQSLVKLGVGIISKDPKLQFLISDMEIVLRPSTKSLKKAKSRKPRTSGRGKWMVVANIARYLSVSVTEIVLKVTRFCPSPSISFYPFCFVWFLHVWITYLTMHLYACMHACLYLCVYIYIFIYIAKSNNDVFDGIFIHMHVCVCIYIA